MAGELAAATMLTVVAFLKVIRAQCLVSYGVILLLVLTAAHTLQGSGPVPILGTISTL